MKSFASLTFASRAALHCCRTSTACLNTGSASLAFRNRTRRLLTSRADSLVGEDDGRFEGT